MIDNVVSLYLDYRKNNYMERLDEEILRRHVHVLDSILRNESDDILALLYNIYAKLPHLEEGLHELEHKDEYKEVLNNLYMNWGNLYNLSASYDSGLTLDISQLLAHCAVEIYNNVKNRG